MADGGEDGGGGFCQEVCIWWVSIPQRLPVLQHKLNPFQRLLLNKETIRQHTLCTGDRKAVASQEQYQLAEHHDGFFFQRPSLLLLKTLQQ